MDQATVLTPSRRPVGVETLDVGKERLLSLDVFRGITMFLLVAEGARVYDAFTDLAPEGSFLAAVVTQFHHHPWNGLRFWDLIQPFFMFIVGVAMAYSLYKRWSHGDSWKDTFLHILKRCAILLLLGVVLHCGYRGRLTWELWNVLSQLSVTVMIAFLIFRLPLPVQLAISFALLAISETLYRTFPVEGFDQPFRQAHNFGAYMDMVLMGKINNGGWVAINALPTAAHTIWGVLAGRVLMSSRENRQKILILALAGLAGVIIGYGLDIAGITPIIKRICTSSFVIVSGGWCLLSLAFLYWLVDVRGIKGWVPFFAIVGMNPIFIYMVVQTVGGQWLNDYIDIFVAGPLSAVGMGEHAAQAGSALVALGVYWWLCYALYRRRIFIRI